MVDPTHEAVAMLGLLVDELREHTRLLDDLVVLVRELAADVENTAKRVDELAERERVS